MKRLMIPFFSLFLIVLSSSHAQEAENRTSPVVKETSEVMEMKAVQKTVEKEERKAKKD